MAIIPVLYDIPLLLIYFLCSSLYLLISCPFICSSPFLLFFGKRKFFLFVSQFLFYTYFHLYYFLGSFFVFCLFMSVAYGGSQVRGQIRAVAIGLYHSSRQRRILNPLSNGGDRTRNLMVPSWICFHFLLPGRRCRLAAEAPI